MLEISNTLKDVTKRLMNIHDKFVNTELSGKKMTAEEYMGYTLTPAAAYIANLIIKTKINSEEIAKETIDIDAILNRFYANVTTIAHDIYKNTE